MVTQRDYSSLLTKIWADYARYAPESYRIYQRAEAVMVDGGSHAMRLSRPFPPRIEKMQGAYIWDRDGHCILDFWQGHFTNILGHNPPVVTQKLAEAFQSGWGLQSGFTDSLQVETAELLCQLTGAEKVRFTTSGTLATMYAILLARAFTGRNLVLKVGGGWHGGQPWSFKGVHYHAGYEEVENKGLPEWLANEVIITRFNDPQKLEEDFKKYGDQIACFIVEPILGAGGYLPATKIYLETARRLADQYGAVLMFDEVVAGFRFCPGSTSSIYGIKPDLSIFGKIMGGGMPVAAVAGRSDLLALAGREKHQQVMFSGGTFSGHPASMLASRTIMEYLSQNAGTIYPDLARKGAQLREISVRAFAEEGIPVCCTGANSDLSESGLFMLHFPLTDHPDLMHSDSLNDPAQFDTQLRTTVVPAALLLENVFLMTSHAAATTAYSQSDFQWFETALRKVAKRTKTAF